jgi:hypothetical protein
MKVMLFSHWNGNFTPKITYYPVFSLSKLYNIITFCTINVSSSNRRYSYFYRLARSRIRRYNLPSVAGVVSVAPPSCDDGDTFRYSELEYGTLLAS